MVPRKFVRIDDLAFRDNGCQSIVAVIERKRNYRELNRAAFIARMDSSPPVNEFDFFHATPRRRDKSTVRLRNVSVFLKSSDTAADLFDALFKGPFEATGTYTYTPTSKLKAKVSSPSSVQISNVTKFAIEEDRTVSPPSVKIYFEGGLAWYLIESVDPTYQRTYDEMSLKARIWLWIQHKRSATLLNNKVAGKNSPSWKYLYSTLPTHLKNNHHKDPLHEFHPYLIEQMIQGDFSGETLSVGPKGLVPRWLDCRLAIDLQNRYPAVWRTIYDRIVAGQRRAPSATHPLEHELLSPISRRTKVQKPSKETRQIQELFHNNMEAVKEAPDLATGVLIISDSLPPSHPWNSQSNDILSKVENHAEALLSDPKFNDAFADWHGLAEIRRFCSDKKWWTKRRIIQSSSRATSMTSFSRAGRRRGRVVRDDSFDSLPASNADTTSADISQDELAVETPAPGYQHHARKGTSVLRPSMSVSQTPATPTRQGAESPASSIIDITSYDDEELQLLRLPEDVSERIQKDISEAGNTRRKLTRKRKFEVIKDEDEVSRKKKPSNPLNRPFQFGRGRPPLTTLPISTNARSTIFRCPFPECSYVRLCSNTPASKAEIDKHHLTHRNEIRDALDMIKDPFISGGRVGGEKGNRLVRPIGAIDHLIERIEEMAKGLGSTPSKRLMV